MKYNLDSSSLHGGWWVGSSGIAVWAKSRGVNGDSLVHSPAESGIVSGQSKEKKICMGMSIYIWRMQPQVSPWVRG